VIAIAFDKADLFGAISAGTQMDVDAVAAGAHATGRFGDPVADRLDPFQIVNAHGGILTVGRCQFGIGMRIGGRKKCWRHGAYGQSAGIGKANRRENAQASGSQPAGGERRPGQALR